MAKSVTLFAIDDEPAILRLFERFLSEQYDVRTFADPADALAALGREQPEGLIVDYRMPHMNGVELVRRARGAGYEGGALIVTAYAELDELAYASQAELIYRVVPKPVSVGEFRELVSLIVADTRFRSKLEGRREHPRFGFQLPLDIRVTGAWEATQALNVSVAGMLLEWHAGAIGGEVIGLRLHGSPVLEASAQVIHTGGEGTGVAFVDPSSAFREALGMLIADKRFGSTTHDAA
jgi:CheY-like chemotaxis protein